MRSILLAAAALSLAFTPAALAKSAPCRDAKGHFAKCPPASTAPTTASTGTSTTGAGMSHMGATSGSPVCKIGKPCGHSCISKDKVCHK